MENEEKIAKTEIGIFNALDDYYARLNFKKNKNINSNVTWTYSDKEGKLKCKKDDRGINVYYQSSFSFDDLDNYYETMKNCLKLFNDNDNPIVLIQDHNGGGMEEVTFSMQELIQNKFEVMNYNSFRDSEQVKINLDMMMDKEKKIPFASRYHDLETCTPFTSSSQMFKEIEKEDFGEGAIHNHTKPFIMTVGPDYRKKIDEIKKTFDRKRSPTKIIVYTDSFSYSCTCFFIKAWQEFGGAIIVGYNGNPKQEGIEYFDACQSPSGYLDEQIKTDADNKLNEMGFFLQSLTEFESYSSKTVNSPSPRPPREFEFRAIDERVDIYEKYNDDENYDKFIDYAIDIFKKYENFCNPENKELMLDSEDCETKFENAYTHGGYQCGDNGKWDFSECKPYYCDIGYYFDQYHKKCVKNPCHKYDNSSKYAKISLAYLIILLGMILI